VESYKVDEQFRRLRGGLKWRLFKGRSMTV
jgi:hypothetical protein